MAFLALCSPTAAHQSGLGHEIDAMIVAAERPGALHPVVEVCHVAGEIDPAASTENVDTMTAIDIAETKILNLLTKIPHFGRARYTI